MNKIALVRTIAFLSSCLMILPAGFAIQKNQVANELPRGIVKKLDSELIPAWQANNEQLFCELMIELIEKAKPNQLTRIEDHCKAHGIDSIQEQFTESMIRQLQFSGAHKLRLPVVFFLSEQIAKNASGAMSSLGVHVAMSDPLQVPDDWNKSEKFFAEVREHQDRLEDVRAQLELAAHLFAPHERAVRNIESKSEKAVIANLEKIVQQLPGLQKELLERSAELHWMRFESAVKSLHGGGDFEKKLKAAISLEMDAEFLNNFFANNDRSKLQRAAIKDPQIVNSVSTMLVNSREVAGDISIKARLFRGGLEQWTRGRYGAGPLGMGLLKAPEAMNSPDEMNSVFLPGTNPEPINPYYEQEEQTPGYTRRHFYTWAVENCAWFWDYKELDARLIRARNSVASHLVQVPTPNYQTNGVLPLPRAIPAGFGKRAKLSKKPCPDVVKKSYLKRKRSVLRTFRAGFQKDETIPYRLVGSYEYGNAMEMLEPLVRTSTPDQIKVYDKLINERKQFSIFSGVASKQGDNEAPKISKGYVLEFDKAFQKSSLAWMMALARIELAATMSMYGESENPFLELMPNEHGRTEFISLLLDDLSAHLFSLSKEQRLGELCKNGAKPDSDTLAYLRRMKLITDMLQAAKTGGGEYANRAEAYQGELDRYRKKLVTKVFLATVNIEQLVQTEEYGVITRCRRFAEELETEE